LWLKYAKTVHKYDKRGKKIFGRISFFIKSSKNVPRLIAFQHYFFTFIWWTKNLGTEQCFFLLKLRLRQIKSTQTLEENCYKGNIRFSSKRYHDLINCKIKSRKIFRRVFRLCHLFCVLSLYNHLNRIDFSLEQPSYP